MYTLEGRRTCAGSDGPTPDTRAEHARYSLYVRRPVAHTLIVPEGDHQLLLLLAQLEVLLVLLCPCPSSQSHGRDRPVMPAKHGSLPTQNVRVSEYESREGMVNGDAGSWMADPLFYALDLDHVPAYSSLSHCDMTSNNPCVAILQSASPDCCHSLDVRCLYAQRPRYALIMRRARADHSLRALFIRVIFQLVHSEYAVHSF